MVAFNKQRVQYDDETKRIIYEEYINTRQSMAQVADKYNINVNTVNNIVKKFKALKKKEEQFFKDNNVVQSKPFKPSKQKELPKQRPLNMTQEVRKTDPPKQNKQVKQSYEPPQKPQNELRKSSKREKIVINTSDGVPAEPFKPRPRPPKNEGINLEKTEKKLDRRSSILNILDDMHKRVFNQ